jgi:cytochrome c peroxidase
MKRGQLYLLLGGFLALLTAILAVTLLLPKDVVPPETGPGSPEPPFGRDSAILPIPSLAPEEFQSGKVRLGEMLFNDAQLSGDGTISCATCHILAHGGDDGRKVSLGTSGAKGDVNAPTVFNSVFNFRQFWDGRAANLQEQVSGPLNNIAEMASSWEIATRRVVKNPEYVAAFKREYDGEISERTITDALVRFEATLRTPNAPFDRYLNGDTTAISDEAREGYRRFTDYGCISCHQGINVGGNFFQRFGVMGNYFTDRGSPTKADLGRYNVTGQEEDRYVFKVPGLRNVAVTAPYFHDGNTATLDQAVDVMGRYQLGRELSEEDRRYLVAFLESLTGEYRGVRLQP